MSATSKALPRRLRDPMFRDVYFVGDAIDIGPGPDSLAQQCDPSSKARKGMWPKLKSVLDWDLDRGDATFLDGIANASFDLVYSSHCLEHIANCSRALTRWWEVVKPGGYLVLVVPDEDLYEQGTWPPQFNGDHKHTFTIQKATSWSPVSINLTAMFARCIPDALIIKMERIEEGFDWTGPVRDQTGSGPAESSIECILRKP